jgi:chromosome partitioning protein
MVGRLAVWNERWILLIIAVIQQKGGVGKSTIAANVAVELVHTKRRVLMFDLDAQRTLARWAKRGQGALNGRVQAMEIAPGEHRVFAAAVASVTDADYIVLDCPPSFADAAVSAAMVADIALVPVTPSPVDVETARLTRDLLREVQLKRGGKPIIAFVPSKVQPNTWGRGLAGALEKFGELVLPGIGQRVGNVDCAADGLGLREYEPNNKGVAEYAQLLQAVEQRMEAR